ncbi:hypothetical protein TIFTF001_031137 [Ficus carica]|uniref:Cytochrome P450 n=1 Tax=Ficus carica TaxID=3494 RepID=A0AA88J4R8_FICCA|nr:hypothetical protein TIFTF001_031137 [Ficus carica]
MAKEVMKTHDTTFANRPFLLAAHILSYGATGITFSPYGEYWRQIRKICVMEFFGVKRVQSFKSIREGEVSSLIETIGLKAGSTINLSREIISSVYGITARAGFGKKSGDVEVLIEIVKNVSRLGGGFSLADLYPSFKVLEMISGMRRELLKLHGEIDEVLDKIINEHEEKKMIFGEKGHDHDDDQEDLVDVLLRLQKNGDLDPRLTASNIRAILLDIMSAGSDTSSTTVEWTISELLKNPKVMKKAQSEVRQVFHGKEKIDETELDELKYLRSVIKETLRLHPSAPLLLPRESSQSCVIRGYEIPAKTKVIVNAWAIGRDPAYWSEADKFIPERFLDNSVDYKGSNFEFIPFGAGRRICPGLAFGVASVELILARLLFHFDWKLPNNGKPEDLDMTEVFGISVGRKTDLCLVPIPYNP